MTPRRSDILRALDIQTYVPRSTSTSDRPPRAQAVPRPVGTRAAADAPPPETAARKTAPVAPPKAAAPKKRSLEVPAEVAPPKKRTVAAPSDATARMTTPDVQVSQMPRPSDAGAGVESLDWDGLRATVAACRLCGLCETRTQTVFGTGDRQADWLIVGEAPGVDEDRQGEPFVGRAGQLLNAMLSAAGRPRGKVYIANILKCRPPSNRDPHVDEAAACRPYLDRQIALLQPRLILVVGRIAAHSLLGVDTPLGRLRGQVYSYGKTDPVPLVVTYHPAYLLRSPTYKRQAWEDLLFAQRVATSAVH